MIWLGPVKSSNQSKKSKRIPLSPRPLILLASRVPWKIPWRASWTAGDLFSWNRDGPKNTSLVQKMGMGPHIIAMFWGNNHPFTSWAPISGPWDFFRRLWMVDFFRPISENVQDGLSGDEESGTFSVFPGFSGWWTFQMRKTMENPWFPVRRMICRWCGVHIYVSLLEGKYWTIILVVLIAKKNDVMWSKHIKTIIHHPPNHHK